MVLPLRTGVKNLVIWKYIVLYEDVDYVQEVHDVDSDWRKEVTWLVTDYRGRRGCLCGSF